MDQRRLQTIGENLQLRCRSVAAGAAHDENTPRGIDPARDTGDVLGARRDLRAWLQSLDAGDVAVGVRQDDVLRQCEMRNATARIGGGNCLMNHRGSLLRRDDGFRVKRDIAKQEIGLRGLEVVNAVQLARHVAGDCEHRGMIVCRLVEARDQMVAARPRGPGADRKTPSKLGLACGGKCSALFMAHANPFDGGVPHRVG
jgi:hypothetical protein